MKSLFPIYKDENKNLMLMQTIWAQTLNKFLSNPLLAGTFLSGLSLISGNNTINHLLGRPIQGVIVVWQDEAASFYQLATTTQDLTFIMNASAPVNVSMYVF